ncbi:MAG: 50S ribosomal protein L21, partial [Bdellovibrionota bacterium]
MYAVIQAGGKQYRVQPGDVLQIEKVEGEVGKGMTFDQVLFTSKMNPEAAQVTIGKPLISGAK